MLFAMLAPVTPVMTRPQAVTQDAAQEAAQDDLEPEVTFPCTTSLKIVRLSEIKPGKMAKFLQAAAAQQAWYKDAGAPDEIEVLRVLKLDPATKSYTFSDAEAMTSHIEPFGRPKGRAQDSRYGAFVKMYRDSSTIKQTYLTCVSK
jgi:hypothetical protein